MALSKIARAWGMARRSWKLKRYIESGREIVIPDKLSKYIIETLAIVWLAGYAAGKRDAKKVKR